MTFIAAGFFFPFVNMPLAVLGPHLHGYGWGFPFVLNAIRAASPCSFDIMVEGTAYPLSLLLLARIYILHLRYASFLYRSNSSTDIAFLFYSTCHS